MREASSKRARRPLRQLRAWCAQHAYVLVFLSLIAVPAVNLIPVAMDSDIKSQWLFFIEVLFGFNLIHTYRRRLPRWLYWFAAACGLVGTLVSAVNLSSIPINIHYVMGGCFFCFFAVTGSVVFRRVVGYTVTNRETLFAALSGYLLIGFIAFFLFSELEQLLPGSFVMTSTGKPAGPNELFYFAYVTILTIGYGDIAPVTWPARNATILMAILGYTYSLVFIARIVNDLGSPARRRQPAPPRENQ